MVARRFGQEMIYIDGTRIRAESVEWTIKQDTTELTASDMLTPYGVIFGAETYEIQLSKVDPYQKNIFLHWKKVQNNVKGEIGKSSKNGRLPKLTTFNYDVDGNYKPDMTFLDIYITEIKGSNTEPFDVKMNAIVRETGSDSQLGKTIVGDVNIPGYVGK